MAKIAVIYWSGTGNTKIMAQAIAEGAGSDAELFEVSEITAEQAASYESLILGCPSMGDEVLEEAEFEPFYTDLEGKIAGKKVAIFGSYGWGDGEWMRNWQARVESKGAQLFEEGLILNETPDADGVERCKDLGRRFAG